MVLEVIKSLQVGDGDRNTGLTQIYSRVGPVLLTYD